MFKILVLLRFYNFPDEQIEFQINDRLSFQRFPRQRNTRDENKTIKEGKIPEDWKNDDDKKMIHKVSQRDNEARWTKKGDEAHYGYKNHAKADVGYMSKEDELQQDVEAVICEKDYRNHPLTDLQKLPNKIQIAHKIQDRTHIRPHDKFNTRSSFKMHRTGTCGFQHGTDESCEQYVQNGDITEMQ